jgi:hypothetical protein
VASFPQLSAIPKAFGDALARAFAGTSQVISGLALTAQGAGTLQINVASGTAWVNGVFVNYAGGNVVPGAASATPRYDLIRIASGAAVPSIIAGTPSAGPVESALPAGDLFLGTAFIPAGASDYTSGGFIAEYTIPFNLPPGSAANPSQAFAADLTTGIFRAAAATLGITTSGVERARVSGTGLQLTVPLLFSPDNTVAIGASAATRPTIGWFSIGVAGGTNPSPPTTGLGGNVFGMPSSGWLVGRNAANNADNLLIRSNSADQVETSGGAGLALVPNSDNNPSLGTAARRWGGIFSGQDITLSGGARYLVGATGGVVNRVKAGAPADGDFANPVDGLGVADTTNNKWWIRVGGVWKGVAVA